MKHYKALHLGILCLLVSISTLQAQESVFFVFQDINNTVVTTNIQQKSNTSTTPIYYRHHKKLPVTYSGIVLELITSDLPLKRNHSLFKQFGNVYYDTLDEGGYAYSILTDYKDIDKAKKYLNKMIIHRAPKAKVVKYQLGRRKKEVQ